MKKDIGIEIDKVKAIYLNDTQKLEEIYDQMGNNLNLFCSNTKLKVQPFTVATISPDRIGITQWLEQKGCPNAKSNNYLMSNKLLSVLVDPYSSIDDIKLKKPLAVNQCISGVTSFLPPLSKVAYIAFEVNYVWGKIYTNLPLERREFMPTPQITKAPVKPKKPIGHNTDIDLEAPEINHLKSNLVKITILSIPTVLGAWGSLNEAKVNSYNSISLKYLGNVLDNPLQFQKLKIMFPSMYLTSGDKDCKENHKIMVSNIELHSEMDELIPQMKICASSDDVDKYQQEIDKVLVGSVYENCIVPIFEFTCS